MKTRNDVITRGMIRRSKRQTSRIRSAFVLFIIFLFNSTSYAGHPKKSETCAAALLGLSPISLNPTSTEHAIEHLRKFRKKTFGSQTQFPTGKSVHVNASSLMGKNKAAREASWG